MKNPKTLLTVVGALALVLVGFLFFRSPKPIIEIKGEKLADIGPFPLLNTYVTSVIVVIVLIVVARIATRNLNIVPRGLQNAVEGVVEALYNICINTAGEQNARRFFPVIGTIFVYIWIANWMALLPGFISIGAVQEVNAHHFHKEAVIFTNTSGVGLIKPNDKELEFEVDETACASFDDEIAEAKAAGEDTAELKHGKDECIEHAREEAILEELHTKELIPADVDNLEAATAHLEEDGKTLGILVPYLRSMNTDLNSPLSIALWAMIFVEFWGITALGLFKYAGKFFNFSSPIYFVVGLLELVAEIARIISFTFRLFGNMLAGEILLLVMTFLVPFLVALPFYGLEVFVGVIQAFVFAMLTLVFGVLAVSAHDEHEEHEDGDGHETPGLPQEGLTSATH